MPEGYLDLEPILLHPYWNSATLAEPPLLFHGRPNYSTTMNCGEGGADSLVGQSCCAVHGNCRTTLTVKAHISRRFWVDDHVLGLQAVARWLRCQVL